MLSEPLQNLIGVTDKTTNEDVLAAIDGLSVEALRKCFFLGWSESKAAFARAYSLDRSGFGKWTSGSRPTDELFETTIRTWLKQLHSDTLGPHSSFAPLNMKEFAQVLKDRLVPAVNAGTLKAIVFVDGDQAMSQLSKLSWLLDNTTSVHVVVSARMFSRHFKCKDWCTAVACHSTLKNAADNAIVLQVGMCLYALQGCLEDPSLYIVTRDLFAEALVSQVVSFGTRATVVDPTTEELDAILLENTSIIPKEFADSVRQKVQSAGNSPDPTALVFDVPKHLTPNALLLAAEHSLSTSSCTSPDLRSCLIDTPEDRFPAVLYRVKHMLAERLQLSIGELVHKFYLSDNDKLVLNGKTWFQILRQPHVQAFLGAVLTEVSPNNFVMMRTPTITQPHKTAASSKADDTLGKSLPFSDDELRAYWKLYWTASQGEFCAKYHINQGNFSSWINKKRSSSPASSRAVRLWLTELGKFVR